MKTAWQLEHAPKYPKFRGELKADVAIVGGGLCGVMTAYQLAKSGKTVVLLEAKRIGGNATVHTTAFLTHVIDTELADLVKMFGKRNARLVWESHAKAIDLIETIAVRESIDCEFVRCSNFMYAADEQEKEALREEAGIAKGLGFDVRMHESGFLGLDHSGFMEIHHQAKFHPMKFLYGLAEAAKRYGALMYEQSEVREIKGLKTFKAITQAGTVTADHVVIATYDPLHNPKATKFKKGMYVSYIHEYEVERGTFPEWIYEDLGNPYHYFRVDPVSEKKDRVIFGGEDHREEIEMSPAKNFRALEEYWKRVIGNRPYEFVRKWNGPILEPSDGLALIGKTKVGQYVACAFSGNGMTYSAIASQIFHDLIHGRKNPYISLYDPTRVPKLRQLWRKGRDYTEELVRGAVSNSVKYRGE